MIISHQHKFIFIKTAKTAGTSIEIALSQYCGPDDIITPISPKDEALRAELGYRGPQNYKIPLRQYSPLDYLRALRNRKPLSFYNHAPAQFIRRYVDDRVWSSYYKFAFERNPYEKAISWYHWVNNKGRPINEFIESGGADWIRGYGQYTIKGEMVADKVYRFEEISDAVKDIAQVLSLPGPLRLPNAKGGARKDRRSYREVLSHAARRRVESKFANEFELFGYEW